MQNKKGYFLTFEGADGVGKSTQIQLLMEYFKQNNIDALATREPGGTKTGEQVRNILLDPENHMTSRTETLLYLAARSEHVDKIIMPALKDDKIVVSDRFSHSTFVYQGIARGLGIDVLQTVNLFSTDGLQPDLTFVLDAPVEFLAHRIKKRKSLDRIEKEGLEFQKLVQQGFLQLAKQNLDKIVIIDATKTIEQMQESIVKIVQEKLTNIKGGQKDESSPKC